MKIHDISMEIHPDMPVYLSVEPFDSGMKVHQTLVPAMTVFEGLDLREVSAGNYIFVGLPLRIKTDGAPARAVLISL